MTIILGIKLNNLNEEELMEKISSFIESDKSHYIVTPNPEIILSAGSDEEFFYILNKADISLPDGFGLILAARLFGKKLKRLTGSDTTPKILKLAEEKGKKVMILNRSDGLSSPEEIKESISKKFPKLNFQILNVSRDKNLSSDNLEKINYYGPAIIFSTLGFPYQEKQIYHNLNKIPSLRLAIGVGGSFDYLSGKINRGPKIFRRLGLEWFWRLINAFNYKNSGKRIKRIFKATIVFMFKVLKVRFTEPFLYRANVTNLLYRRREGKIEVLVVERSDEDNHWQLTQGGTDGESLAKAGARELREELGTDKFIAKATFKNVYCYKYNKDGIGTTVSRNYKCEYKGQRQGLFIAEFTGEDSDIKINFWDHQNFRWVDINQLSDFVHPCRKAGVIKFLEKFNTLKIN